MRVQQAGQQVNLVTVWVHDEAEPWLLMTNLTDAVQVLPIHALRFWIEEMFANEKNRGLNLEATCLHPPERLEHMLIAVRLAYFRMMEIIALIVRRDLWH